MPGGKGNIKPTDNPHPFTESYNGRDYEKWTEKKVHQKLDELEQWLLEDVIISDDDGEIIEIKDKGNCFYKGWLYKQWLYDSWISYVCNKFTTVSHRFEDIDKIQMEKLQILGSDGKHNVSMNKFILTNKHKWSESSKNIIEHKGLDIDLKDLINFKDDEE